MSSAGAVQIITPQDHKFELQLENLKQFFESADIKDRDVVLLSIAGPYRKGKSFILNFFLRYLHAQVIENCSIDRSEPALRDWRCDKTV